MNTAENQKGKSRDEEDKSSQYAMQPASASVLPMVLKAALELGVLDIIQRGGPGALHLSPSQIASELKAHNPDTAALALDRLLRLLSGYFVLTCSVSHNQPDGKALRLYGLAPVSEYFVPNHEGASAAPLLFLMQDKVYMDI